MTLSEKICQDINRKFYFDDFVLTNLFYYKNKVKMEICDGLIEFEDCYVLIQIKEQTENSNISNWLNKKVYKKAVEQIKKSIEILSTEQDIVVEDMCGQKIKLKSNKNILPVIIFKAHQYNNYKKVYHSKTLNLNINIFSLEDYEIMMNTLLVPVDIIDYMFLRKEAFEFGNFNILIDEQDDFWTSFANIDNEADISKYFLTKKIKTKTYNLGAVKDFLGIIQKYYTRRTGDNKEYKQVLYRMLRLDRFGADLFMQRWVKSWENAKNKILNYSCHIVLKNNFEKFGFLFISTKKGIKEDSENFYKFITNMFIQQYHLDTAIAIISYYEENDNYFVNWLMMTGPFKEDEEMQNFLKENNPWKYTIKNDNN